MDTLVLVAAVKDPNPDLFVYRQNAHYREKNNNVDAVLCINKSDLCDSADAEKICKIYKNAGIKTIVTSTLSNVGIDELKGLINGKVTAFAGFSGVGKSSILKSLRGLICRPEASAKIKQRKAYNAVRGTFEYADGSYLADTPGFSMLDLPKIAPEELWQYYPEFF
ncbi:MAG: GTPase RsgA [Clostridiales bacterium]|nr:MAG: GTPase RsgA [Clostridiales bacterium]